MPPLDPLSKSFRLIVLPLCMTYFLICVLFGGWPLNLIFQDSLFNGRIAFILIVVCILYSRNVFKNITRETVIEGLGFFAILGIAGYLRFKGIRDLALSGPTIDEPLLVRPVLRMLRTGSYDFANYEYGGVFFYVLAIAFIIMIFRGISRFWYRSMNDIPESEYYTAGRLATAFFSLASVACTYGIARKYFGRLPAIAASLILTFSMLSFTNAHQVRLDVALALWVLLAHWFFLRMLDDPSSLNYALAGIFCGLSVGTKYTVAPIFISLFIAHMLSKKEKWLDWNLVLAMVCGIGLYLITNLYAFINIDRLLIRLPNAVYHLNPKHWSSVPNRALEHTFTLMGQGIGIVALLAALVTLPRVLAKPDTVDARASSRLLVLWCFPFFHLFLIGSYPSGFPRYLLPVLPLLAILAGEGLRIVLEWTNTRVQIALPLRKLIAPVALAILIVQPALSAFQHYSELEKALPPKEIIAWIEQNIPDGSRILSDPTGPVINSNRYDVTSMNYAQFMEPRNVRGFDYVCVSEDLFKRIPGSYELLHEFPSRTKYMDRSIRIYKRRE